MATAKPIGRKPGFFLVMAFLHGLLALILLPTLLLLGVFIIAGDPELDFDFGDVLLGLFFVLLILFITVMAISFLAQFFNALTMFWRSLGAAGDQQIGTYANYGRYVELLPYPTTPWSRFWTNVQEKGWMQWRTIIALLAIILIPFTSFLFPLRELPIVFLTLAVVLLGVAGYFFAAQVRQWPLKKQPPRLREDLDYERGLAYRDRKRRASLASLKKEALAKGALPSTFDLWVKGEIMEALLDDPGAHTAIRNGSTDAMAGPVRAAFIATEGLVDPDRLRELTLELAAPAAKAKKPSKPKKPTTRARTSKADPPPSPYAPK